MQNLFEKPNNKGYVINCAISISYFLLASLFIVFFVGLC